MRILIIGGGGLLGSYLTNALNTSKNDIAICDNFSGSIQYRANKHCRIFTSNATDLNSLEHVFKVFKPEVIISTLAHYFGPDSIYKFYEDTKLILDSVNGLSYLLNSNIKKVIFCSSHEVYEGSSRPIKESRKIVYPFSYHGSAKLAAENILQHRCYSLGIPLVIARIFDMYGPRLLFCAKTGVVNFMINSFINNEQIGIVGPKRLHDFIHVEDVADILVSILKTKQHGIFNVGTGKGTTLPKIFKALKEHLDIVYNPQFIIDDKGKNFSLVSNIDKLKFILPEWQPKHTLFNTLSSLVNFRYEESKLYNNTSVSSSKILSMMRAK